MPSHATSPRSSNLGDLIRPDISPERLALIDLTPPKRQWSYRELDAAAEAFAAALAQSRLGVGERVAILAENCAEYLIAYMGSMRAGAIAVPVNHRLPAETVRFILSDCAACMCVVDAARAALVPSGLRRILIRDEGEDGWAAFLRRASTAGPIPRGAAPEIAEILYTSGSTGRPKGVVLSHGGQLWALHVHVGEKPALGERGLIVAPLYHMNGLCNISVCMLNAVEAVLMPRFDAAAYLTAVAEHRCTMLSGIPTMFALMARQHDLLATLDLTSVKAVSIGSAPLTEAAVARVQDMFPKAVITNGYGTTEAGPSIFAEHPQGLPRPLLSIGYPLPEVDVRLVDGTDREGVLQVRSPAMFSEYLNLPQVTHDKLRDGWYDTGDVMRRDQDGFYYFAGRADDMFVCGGENVFPGEIEKMLERHPAVLQAAVVPAPDEIKGEIPIAFVVLKDRNVSMDELKRFALESGPGFSHPRAFVAVHELPVATTHKLDRRALKARALEIARTLKR